MSIKITLEDEFGVHELTSDSDCICIVDDGEGNISLTEDCDDDYDPCIECYECWDDDVCPYGL